MKKLLLLLLLSLGYISSANAAIPEWTGQNTIVDICRKIDCHDQIKEFYKQYYFSQTFNKALVISYYKSGNRYINDYFGYSFKEPNSVAAKNKAMKMCQKHGKKCELLLVNNRIYNKQLYALLTSSSSYSSNSSNNIPANAFPSSSSPTGWKCRNDLGYIAVGNSCLKKVKNIPANAYLYGDTWLCNRGYKKSGNVCVSNNIPSNTYIPKNGYATNYGFECYGGYKKTGSSCIKINIPANAYAYGSSWKCNSGYKKTGISCTKKITIPPNAYAYGSSWKCNSGYIKIDNSCIEDDKIYLAGSGTGFAATSDGHIVTNYHVIKGCTQVAVHDQGKSYITTIITKDPKSDLAILKSDLKPSIIYPLSTDLYLSDEIYSAGYPFGRFRASVNVNRGIISALTGPDDDISKFQIDAGLNPGNSGGPIVDKLGNALGVAVAKLDEDYALEEYGSIPELFNFAVNSMMVIGLFRSQGIELPEKNITELSLQERSKLFNEGTFYLACGMTIAQYEKMEKTNKVMFSREVVFSDLELD